MQKCFFLWKTLHCSRHMQGIIKKSLAVPGSLIMKIFCPLLFSSPSISINQGDYSQQEADLGG